MHSELPSLLSELSPRFPNKNENKESKARSWDLSAQHWQHYFKEPETCLKQNSLCLLFVVAKYIKFQDCWGILLENHSCGNCFSYLIWNTDV